MTTHADAITFQNLMADRRVAVPACKECGATLYGLHSWDCPTAKAERRHDRRVIPDEEAAR